MSVCSAREWSCPYVNWSAGAINSWSFLVRVDSTSYYQRHIQGWPGQESDRFSLLDNLVVPESCKVPETYSLGRYIPVGLRGGLWSRVRTCYSAYRGRECDDESCQMCLHCQLSFQTCESSRLYILAVLYLNLSFFQQSTLKATWWLIRIYYRNNAYTSNKLPHRHLGDRRNCFASDKSTGFKALISALFRLSREKEIYWGAVRSSTLIFDIRRRAMDSFGVSYDQGELWRPRWFVHYQFSTYAVEAEYWDTMLTIDCKRTTSQSYSTRYSINCMKLAQYDRNTRFSKRKEGSRWDIFMDLYRANSLPEERALAKQCISSIWLKVKRYCLAPHTILLAQRKEAVLADRGTRTMNFEKLDSRQVCGSFVLNGIPPDFVHVLIILGYTSSCIHWELTILALG